MRRTSLLCAVDRSFWSTAVGLSLWSTVVTGGQVAAPGGLPLGVRDGLQKLFGSQSLDAGRDQVRVGR